MLKVVMRVTKVTFHEVLSTRQMKENSESDNKFGKERETRTRGSRNKGFKKLTSSHRRSQNLKRASDSRIYTLSAIILHLFELHRNTKIRLHFSDIAQMESVCPTIPSGQNH